MLSAAVLTALDYCPVVDPLCLQCIRLPYFTCITYNGSFKFFDERTRGPHLEKIEKIDKIKFLRSGSRKGIFQESRSRLGLEKAIFQKSRSRLGLEKCFSRSLGLVSVLKNNFKVFSVSSRSRDLDQACYRSRLGLEKGGLV